MRDRHTIYRIACLVLVTHVSWPVSLDAQAERRGADPETLESVAARSPTEAVEISVKFKTVQRRPAIVEMLRDSELRLLYLGFKFVGSGGGGLKTMDETVDQTLDKAEAQHRLFIRRTASGDQEFEATDCPVDDASAPVVDTTGIPGTASVELACGLRIVELRLSGTAAAATMFRDANGAIADVQRLPSTDEVQRILQELMNR